MAMMDDPRLELLFAHLDHVRPVRTARPGIAWQWIAQCPACAGNRRDTLSVALSDDDNVLLNCHKHGCAKEDILSAIGLSMSALYRPPVPAGERPPRAEGSKREVIALQLRTCLTEPMLARDVLNLFEGFACAREVRRVFRDILGGEMTKIGFPAVSYWMPIDMLAPTEGTLQPKSQGGRSVENSQMSSNGAGSHRGDVPPKPASPLEETESPDTRKTPPRLQRGRSGPSRNLRRRVAHVTQEGTLVPDSRAVEACVWCEQSRAADGLCFWHREGISRSA